MTVLAWLGLWIAASSCLAIIWMALHAPPRRYPHRAEESDPIEPDAVTTCKLCGPTAAAIERDGYCWRCGPVARRVHETYVSQADGTR